jgi:AcrR family transcriptional regulator
MSTESPRVKMRARTRRIIQAELTEVAQDLFVDSGYEATTVEAIADAAGMSKRTFFRYFASKEDLVIGKYNLFGDRLVEALADRPQDEPAWESLRVILHVFDEYYDDPHKRARSAAMEAIVQSSPSLNAAYLDKLSRMQKMLAAEIRTRLLLQSTGADPRPEALVGSAFACLVAAKASWQASDKSRAFSELLDKTMAMFNPDWD